MASENVRLTPLMLPAGVSESTNAAEEPAALNEFTVVLRPLTRLVKFETLVERPPTVLLTVASELVSVFSVVVRLPIFEVKLVMETACPETVVFKAAAELDSAVNVFPWVVTVEFNAPTVVFKLDTDAA